MKREILQFWKANKLERYDNLIDNTANALLKNLTGLSEDALKSLQDTWQTRASVLRNVIESLFNSAEEVTTTEDGKAGLMELLVQYFIYRHITVALQQNDIPKELPTPIREEGESIESYKQRLQQYIDTL